MNEPSGKALGGINRAKSLSDEERHDIASAAAKARWEIEKDMPRATHTGDLTIGDMTLPCAVLENGIRVLSESGIASAMGSGGNRSGGSKRKKAQTALEGRAPLPIFMNSTRLEPFIYQVFGDGPIEIIQYKSSRKTLTGYPADLLPKFCEVWLKAREAGVLQIQQLPRSQQAEILTRGLAHIGIVALVDEATGYQDVRDRQALQVILDKYLKDEYSKWTKTFSDDFYKNLFRLKGLPYPSGEGTRKPGYVGHWTNDIVYSRLAPGILKELKKKNPRQGSGERKRKHHQHMTKDVGHPLLTEHISNVTFLMSASKEWAEFKRMLNQAKPKYGDTIPLDL